MHSRDNPKRNNQLGRLGEVLKVPRFAAIDHRFFLDAEGRDVRLAALSRSERRRINAESRRLGAAYSRILSDIERSGAGYPVDQLLRQMAIEYTHRYASSGAYNQPLNFNYFEPFCEIMLIEEVAPYAYPTQEVDHLFGISDYFDYITTPERSEFSLSELKALPEGKAFHFTPNGSVWDFTFLTAEGREFVIGGFSIIRRGNFLHWYVVGGEVFSDGEWAELRIDENGSGMGEMHPWKRPFLTEAMAESGKERGPPLALEGTATAMRTVIAGETDLTSSMHLGRCYMSEWEHSFEVACDDPDIFEHIENASTRTQMAQTMHDRVEHAAVMWNLAEALFQLPVYFDFKEGVVRQVAVSGGRTLTKVPKGGRGVGAQFRYVSAIEFTDADPPVVRPFNGPRYHVETDGHWRRLPRDMYGWDRWGNPVRGRTWVNATNKWRERCDFPRTIYIKASVRAARIKVGEYVANAEAVEESLTRAGSTGAGAASLDTGVVYVLRCAAMKDEVYKVGWTSGTAEERAKELSSATGVPSSFIVVASWKHPDPQGLESGVHAMLAPYRLSEGREFFKVNFSIIKDAIDGEIARAAGRSGV